VYRNQANRPGHHDQETYDQRRHAGSPTCESPQALSARRLDRPNGQRAVGSVQEALAQRIGRPESLALLREQFQSFTRGNGRRALQWQSSSAWRLRSAASNSVHATRSREYTVLLGRLKASAISATVQSSISLSMKTARRRRSTFSNA
jgi:hypothetical protein